MIPDHTLKDIVIIVIIDYAPRQAEGENIIHQEVNEDD
jgi:hypothetical protein